MPRHVGKRPIREDTHFAAMASTCNKETLKLIEICGDGVMQAQLEGCKHNQEVYDKITKDLIEAGYQRSGQQCRDKIKKLKGEYRIVCDKKVRQVKAGTRCGNFTIILLR